MTDRAWEAIFDYHDIHSHNFTKQSFNIDKDQIKAATNHFKKTSEREVRILCKHDSREKRPQIFKDNGLFILPIKNGFYTIIQGEGYVNIPDIPTNRDVGSIEEHESVLDFNLDTSRVGNSEMQHLDFAYATSLIRHFMNDDSLVLTIRGRKFTPPFWFNVGSQRIDTESVQTEVDGGYEGKNQIVLIEAKNSTTSNTIIRQLYYPFRQWSLHTQKPVSTLFFEKQGDVYSLWHFEFTDQSDYNSIILKRAKKYKIIGS
jgi:Domain of unknown function (DUF6997)/Domain of unknown function (DUF6996)